MFATKSKKSDITLLDFTTDLSEARVNEKNPLLFENVIMLGPESRNARGEVFRKYSDRALQGSVTVLEGTAAYVDHPAPDKTDVARSIKDMYGVYRGVHFVPEEHRVRGNLQICDSDLGRHVAAIIRVSPNVIGNSINAGGRVSMHGGVQIVEEVLSRNIQGFKTSVDLVNDPATAHSLVESRDVNNSNPIRKELNMGNLGNITLTELREEVPGLVEKLVKEGRDSVSAEMTTLKEQVTTLNTQVATLTEEKTKLATTIDTYRVKEQLNAQRATVDALLLESKLPATAITDIFKDVLYSCTERKNGDKVITVTEQVKALIEERKNLIDPKGVKGNTPKTPMPNKTGASETLTSADVLAVLVESTKNG